MSTPKEILLKKLNSAYKRLIVSSGDFETEEFTISLNNELKSNGIVQIYEFIKTYQERSLFIRYKSLLSYDSTKGILDIILTALEKSDTEFYLYLCVPEKEISDVKATLSMIYDYHKERIRHISGSFEDDGYVIEIRDNRHFSTNSFVKIYPNGHGTLITDFDYCIEKNDFSLSDELCMELNTEIKKHIEKIIADKQFFMVDDRVFLDSFIVSYGFEWLGYQRSEDVDYKDYFLENYPMDIIAKIFQIPILKERFVKAKYL